MEKIINKEGLSLYDMKLSEMDVFWGKAKEEYCASNIQKTYLILITIKKTIKNNEKNNYNFNTNFISTIF